MKQTRNRIGVIAAVAATMIFLSAGVAAADDAPIAYWCKYPTTVTVEGHSASTPTICVPGP